MSKGNRNAAMALVVATVLVLGTPSSTMAGLGHGGDSQPFATELALQSARGTLAEAQDSFFWYDLLARTILQIWVF